MNYGNHKYLIASVALCLSLASFYSRICAQEMLLPDNPLQGARIFQQKGCINCHAINGDGGDIAVDLGEEQFHGGFLELAGLMWNHFPDMKAAILETGRDIPVFTEREMEDLFAYLFCVPYSGEPGDEANGKKLLGEKGCLRCHGEGKRDPSHAPDLMAMTYYGSPVYLAQAMWNHGPQMQRQIAKWGMKRPRLSGGEITDMAAYLQSVSAGGLREQVYMQPGNPRAGAKIFEKKSCNVCHSSGSMNKSAPDLSRSKTFTTVTQIAGTMWNHGPDMLTAMTELGVSWPRFSGEEMSDLIAYLFFMKFTYPIGDSRKGREVFQSKSCSNCHSLTAESKRPDQHQIPPVKSPSKMVMLMWNHAPRMDSLMQNSGISWPVFNPEEMTDLYTFLKITTGEEK